MRPKFDYHDCAHVPSASALLRARTVLLRHYQRRQDENKGVTSPLLVQARYLTSIPPHSKTRNKPRSDARTGSMPTTCAQNVAPSSAATRAAAGAQIPKSPGETPQKSMKTRVTTSGTGEMCICAAFSYDACARKRKATYSCLSKSGSQYLQVQPHPRILQ